MNPIEKLRREAGLTQVELAEKLGITQGSIAIWENDKAFPRADKLPELAKVLGCTIEDLYGNKN